MINLRPYQEKANTAVLAAWERGLQRPIVQMSTGLGKTICMAYLTKATKKRTLVIAHRDELVQQAVQKFQLVAPELRAGIVKAEEDDISAPLVVASTQTLMRKKRLDRLLQGGPIELVHVDELHHYVGDNSFGEVVEGLGCLDESGPRTVGWTATPFRADNKELGSLWQEIVFTMDILAGISQGYLCDLKAKQIKLKDLDLSQVRTRGGDYQEGDLGAAMELANAPEHTVEAYRRYAAGRKTIVFTPTVALAEATKDEFTKSGYESYMVCGEDAIDDRRETLRKFAESPDAIISNAAVLLEGYDQPDVSCIIIARPTKSKVLYTQAIGRATRKHPNKPDALILDMVGATSQHDLITMASLFHIKEETAEAGIQALLDSVAQAKQDGKPAPVEADMIAEAVDLLRQQSLHWIPDGPRFMLSAGEETLILFPQDLAWGVRTIPRSRDEMPRLLYSGITLEWAQGVAEDYVRNLGAMGLAKAGARWRKDPPSEKQKEILLQRGRWREGMSKGEASDAITVLFANKRRSY